jgi:PTS system ascorbate-specific IIA component
MIGILLITHGSYGEALIQNACHVLNKRPPLVNQLGVAAQDDPVDLLPLARQMLSLVDVGKGALVLTGTQAAETRPH